MWTGPNGFRSNQAAAFVPSIQYRDTGLYVLNQGFYYGCTTVDSFYLSIFPSTTITASPALAVCEGTSQQLSVTATGGGTFAWYPSAGLSRDDIGNPVAMPKDSTTYKVVVTNSYGCKDSARIDIPVYRIPRITAGQDKVILLGDTAVLEASVSGTAVNFTWLPNIDISDPTVLRPEVFPSQSAEYRLTASSGVGCGTVTDIVRVNVYNELKIPNAFTPNGDGLNDVFYVLPLDNYQLKDFQIFNRFGQIVFQTTDIREGWDGTVRGTLQQTGMYIYRIRMINKRGKVLDRKGTVTLIQ
jgi:gliding motility-associated-like protein